VGWSITSVPNTSVFCGPRSPLHGKIFPVLDSYGLDRYGNWIVVFMRCELSLWLKTYGHWRYSSNILDFGTRFIRVISSTPRPLKKKSQTPWSESATELYRPSERHFRENILRDPWDRLCEPQTRCGRYEEENNLLSLAGFEPLPSSLVARRCTTEL
jgi:hypothetical protein